MLSTRDHEFLSSSALSEQKGQTWLGKASRKREGMTDLPSIRIGHRVAFVLHVDRYLPTPTRAAKLRGTRYLAAPQYLGWFFFLHGRLG
jgi:hypothetical protein